MVPYPLRKGGKFVLPSASQVCEWADRRAEGNRANAKRDRLRWPQT